MFPNEDTLTREILIRLAVAAVIGLVLGINRDLHRKPAGIRVLSLVCIGSCAVTILSWLMTAKFNGQPGDGITRTVQGVLQGVGFLGAGVIMRTRGEQEIHGITTAATIWLCAVLGMVCASGEWLLALATFGAAWVILIIGGWIEHHILNRSHKDSHFRGDYD